MFLEADLSDGTVPKKPKPRHVWFSRAQWDRYFVPGITAAALIVLWDSWLLGELRSGFGWVLLLLALFWVGVRWGSPQQVLMPALAPEATARFWWLVLWFSTGLAGILVLIFLPAAREYVVRLVRPCLILLVYGAGWVMVWWVGVQLIKRRFRNPVDSCEVPAGDLE